MTPENAEQALAVLKLDEKRAVRQMVCFFDTADGALEAQNLILRARQKDGESGQSTVKVRATDGESELSDAERAIPPEQDWTHENGPTLSRSVDSAPLEKGLEVGRHTPTVMMVVGVNGAGKTTTIGKLTRHLAAADQRVLLVG